MVRFKFSDSFVSISFARHVHMHMLSVHGDTGKSSNVLMFCAVYTM